MMVKIYGGLERKGLNELNRLCRNGMLTVVDFVEEGTTQIL